MPDTIKILKDKLISAELKTADVDEIKNYKEAMFGMIKDANERKPLSLQLVLDYHLVAMNHRRDIAGKIRAINVFIKGNPDFKTKKSEEVRKELDNLFDKYNQFIENSDINIKNGSEFSKGQFLKTKDTINRIVHIKRKNLSLEEILKFAVYFHNEFQHIHPFQDGNSRITRLITFHLLLSLDIPIIDIPFGLLDEYLSYTKGSKKRDDAKLYQSIQKIVLFNLKKINRELS